MPVLDLQGRQITYTVAKGRSRRYVYFKFKPDRTLEIRLPQGKADLDAVLQKKRDWILWKYEDLGRDKKVCDDEARTVLFKGRYLKILSGGNQTKIGKNEIILFSHNEAEMISKIKQLYSKETSRYLKTAVPFLARKLSVEFGVFDVKQMKKWGYCSRKGRLSFTWQLIALPKKLRDYVVMHELLHLSEFNHSNSFHKKLASVYPDYKQRELELKHIVPM